MEHNATKIAVNAFVLSGIQLIIQRNKLASDNHCISVKMNIITRIICFRAEIDKMEQFLMDF